MAVWLSEMKYFFTLWKILKLIVDKVSENVITIMNFFGHIVELSKIIRWPGELVTCLFIL